MTNFAILKFNKTCDSGTTFCGESLRINVDKVDDIETTLTLPSECLLLVLSTV